MSENTELIEKFADLTERIDFLTSALAEMLSKAVPAEVLEKMNEIKAEYLPMIESAQAELNEVKTEIEKRVLEYAKANPDAEDKTLKGTRYMAVWAKGRAGGWDADMLKGYALVHPEIMAAKKKDGEPTVTFRKVK